MGIRPDNTTMFIKSSFGTFQPVVQNRCEGCNELVDVLAPAGDDGEFDWYICRIDGDSANGYGLYHMACDSHVRTPEEIADQAVADYPGKPIAAVKYWRREFERVITPRTGELSTLRSGLDAIKEAVYRQWQNAPALTEALIPEFDPSDTFAGPMLRTPLEWCELLGVTIIDNDGWRSADAPDWYHRISRQEFLTRARQCTLTGRLPEH